MITLGIIDYNKDNSLLYSVLGSVLNSKIISSELELVAIKAEESVEKTSIDSLVPRDMKRKVDDGDLKIEETDYERIAKESDILVMLGAKMDDFAQRYSTSTEDNQNRVAFNRFMKKIQEEEFVDAFKGYKGMILQVTGFREMTGYFTREVLDLDDSQVGGFTQIYLDNGRRLVEEKLKDKLGKFKIEGPIYWIGGRNGYLSLSESKIDGQDPYNILSKTEMLELNAKNIEEVNKILLDPQHTHGIPVLTASILKNLEAMIAADKWDNVNDPIVMAIKIIT
jgi:hypothetical protein